MSQIISISNVYLFSVEIISLCSVPARWLINHHISEAQRNNVSSEREDGLTLPKLNDASCYSFTQRDCGWCFFQWNGFIKGTWRGSNPVTSTKPSESLPPLEHWLKPEQQSSRCVYSWSTVVFSHQGIEHTKVVPQEIASDLLTLETCL